MKELYQYDDLLNAILLKDTKAVKNILSLPNINVNAQGANNVSALYLALKRGAKSIIKLLLGRGARQEIQTPDGKTIFELGKESKYSDVFEDFDNRHSLKLSHIESTEDSVIYIQSRATVKIKKKKYKFPNYNKLPLHSVTGELFIDTRGESGPIMLS